MATICRRFLPFLALLTLVSALPGESPPVPRLPKVISAKQALAIVEKEQLAGQGCGGCTWNGEHCGFYLNIYRALKLPWNEKPERIEAGFATKAGQSHLIELSGPGFRYRRTTDVPDLTLQLPEKEM